MSPSGNDRSSPEEIEFTKNFIELATTSLKIDFIALGEVSEANIKNIKKAIGSYEIKSGVESVGRTKFTNCIIYNPEKILVSEYISIAAEKGNRTYKIAQRASIKTKNDNTDIYVFISHWPSRLNLGKNDVERAYYGQKLRDVINETDRNQCRTSHVILMGDYNDEPFDSSLSEHLMASRERPTSASRNHLLYNPFWRKLGYEEPYSQDSNGNLTSAGTCYYRAEQYSRWKTFDQIIFSSNFVGRSDWQLVEEFTQILAPDSILEKVIGPETNFDHLPVISAIKKVNKDG